MHLGLGNSQKAKRFRKFVTRSSTKFDGTDDFVDTGFQPDFIHTNATMSYWVNMDDLAGAQLCGTHNSKRFYLGFYNATAGMGVQDTNNLGSGTDLSSYIAINQWHHIAMVAEGGTATFYLDGVARDTLSYTQNSANNPNANLYIGGVSNSGSAQDFMNGSIDEFAVFSSALTAREIDALYNNGRPTKIRTNPNLALWNRMGEGKLDGKSDGDENLMFDQGPNGGLGSELVTNGTFDADSDWAKSSPTGDPPSTGTISGGTANFTINGGDFIFMNQSVSYVSGSTYTLTATVNGTAGKVMRFMDSGANNGGLTTSNGAITMTGSAQEVSITFTANSNSSTILIARQSNSGDYSFTVDNVSVKEIQNVGTISGAAIQADKPQELITNGTYDTDTTGWTINASSATMSIVSGKLRITSSSSYHYAYQSFTTRVGGVYSFTVDATKGTSPNYDAYFGTTQNGATLFNSGSTGFSDSQGDTRTITGTFTATSTTTFLNLRSRNEGSVTDAFTDFDNVSVKEVTESVPKQCKNLPSAGSLKSLSFDGTDDVVDLGASSTFFSTNVNSISMWFKMPDTSGGAERIFVSNSDAGGSDLRVIVSTGGTISVDFWNGSSLSSTTGGSAIDDDIWHNLVFTTTASAQALYIDGVSVATTTHTRSSRAGSVSATIGAHVASSVYAEVDVDEVAIWDTVLDGDAAKALYNAGEPTPVATNTGAYDIYRDNLQAYYKMGDATVPGADNTNGFLFDQTNPGVGSELVKTDPFVSGSWSGYSANVVTFPSTTTVRVARPTSGGSSLGAAADFNTSILQSTPAAGTTLKISFDLNTDDSDLFAQLYNGSAYTNSTAGSGSKTVYLKMTGTGFIRFGGLDADKFVELSNLTIREVNGHTGTITGATIQTEAPKQIYALPAVANTKSINFDGTNDHLVTQVDDTLATRYYSFWLKSSDTGHNPVFDHGASNVGAFHLNLSGNRPFIYLGNTAYRDFQENAKQDDGLWHHYVVLTDADITKARLFIDAEEQTANSTVSSGSPNAYTSGLRIGRASDVYFEGSIDEFSIHEELDEEAIRALYNRGRPIDISSNHGAYDTYSDNLLHWWRMGDATSPAADGTNDIIFQGLEAESDELVPNGDLSTWTDTDTIATWTHKDSNNNGGGGVISQVGSGEGSGGTGLGSANYFTASGTNMSLTSGTISEAGRTYRLEIEVSRYVQGIIRVQGAVAQDFGASDIVDGKIVKIFTATSATYIRVQGSNACDFTVDNVSLKQVRGQYIGPELVKADADLYQASTWTAYGGNDETFPNGTAARFDRPSSGGDTRGGYVSLTSSEALTSNLETGCVYKLQFDFLTDDSDAFPRYYDGSSYTNLSAGSGLKVHYFGFSGSGFINVDALSADKFVQFSNLSVTKIGGAAVMTNMTTSDIQTDTPY